MEMVGRIFEDPTKMAAFVIGREDSGNTRAVCISSIVHFNSTRQNIDMYGQFPSRTVTSDRIELRSDLCPSGSLTSTTDGVVRSAIPRILNIGLNITLPSR